MLKDFDRSFWITEIILVGLAVLFLVACCATARSHDAGPSWAQQAQFNFHPEHGYSAPAGKQPEGWTYPWECCSGQDCTRIKVENVQQRPDGFHVTLRPGDHPFITEAVGTREYVLAYSDERIKNSPDGDYHICIRSPNTQLPPGAEAEKYGPLAVICFYKGPESY